MRGHRQNEPLAAARLADKRTDRGNSLPKVTDTRVERRGSEEASRSSFQMLLLTSCRLGRAETWRIHRH